MHIDSIQMKGKDKGIKKFVFSNVCNEILYSSYQLRDATIFIHYSFWNHIYWWKLHWPPWPYKLWKIPQFFWTLPQVHYPNFAAKNDFQLKDMSQDHVFNSSCPLILAPAASFPQIHKNKNYGTIWICSWQRVILDDKCQNTKYL